MSRTKSYAGVATVVMIVLVSGCGRTAPSSETTPADSPTPFAAGRTTGDPAQAALGAYRAMWGDVAAASRKPDAASLRLPRHASGEALSLLKTKLSNDSAAGLVAEGAPGLAPRVTHAETNEVAVEDCLDMTRWLMYHRDGRLKDDKPGGHNHAIATVSRTHSLWKVTRISWGRDGTC